MDTLDMSRALTDQERETFEAIREAGNMALVRTRYHGREAAVIAAINEDAGEYIVTPLALLVTDDMIADLEDPTTE